MTDRPNRLRRKDAGLGQSDHRQRDYPVAHIVENHLSVWTQGEHAVVAR
jgi:hypothetical protein